MPADRSGIRSPVAGLIIRTDHKWKDLLRGDEVPARLFKRGGEYDHMTRRAAEEALFAKWRTYYYSLTGFARLPPDSPLVRAGWIGIWSESATTGMLIRLNREDQYMIGTYRTA